MCYSFLYQLLKALLLGWYAGGMTRPHALVFVLASHIRTSGYLLGHLPSKASLLALLSLSLKILLLCFLPLLGLLKALEFSPPTALTMLWLRYLLSATASAPSPPMRLASVCLASVILP